MREHSVCISEENGRSVEFAFNNDGGCQYLTVKTFKPNKGGELDVISVLIEREDACAVIEILQAFTKECTASMFRAKGA